MMMKLHKKKAPKKGRGKEMKGNDQSFCKQTTQKRRATLRKGHTKYPNLLQSLQAYQLKKGKVSQIKLLA